MVESDAKANQEEEFKDLFHKPEVNLKQVDNALNGNVIYFSLETLFTFGTPANELSTETLQDASKVIVNHCTTEDPLDDIWNRKAWKIMVHVTLYALYLTLKSAKGETYSETMD
ncbi:hypothetical protein DSO57_1000194 [Entomophthora muscae]|uniref:Uncharacterized protein n=1 Tax=Entomophthora muscae TaxID=34485 RepID=A0ACC2U8Y7_9FUNG|nr:hypothetical protein DSO57_1000194 [Entomophthora muscae]